MPSAQCQEDEGKAQPWGGHTARRCSGHGDGCWVLGAGRWVLGAGAGHPASSVSWEGDPTPNSLVKEMVCL